MDVRHCVWPEAHQVFDTSPSYTLLQPNHMQVH